MDENNLELQMSVAEMKTDIKYLKEGQDKIIERLDRLDTHFAGKWVEKISVGSLLAMITAVITFILTK